MICALQAQSQTNKTLPLSLQQAVEMAVEHNLDVQISRYQPLFDEFALSGDYAVYEPAFNSAVQRAWQTSPGSVSSTGVVNFANRSDDSNVAAGIGNGSGGMATTPWGMGYQLSTALDKTTFLRSSNGFPDFSDQARANAEIDVRQPLLRNAWIDANRRDILIAKKTINYDELGFRLQALNIVAQTEQAYYELIYDFENVKVQQAAVDLAAQQANEDRKRVQVGAMAPLDAKQTESQLAASRAALLAAQQTLGTQENVLKGLITDAYRELYAVTIVPAEKLVAVPEQIDLQESWQNSLKLRPDLLQAKVDLERKGITVRYAKNQLFPQLDFVGKYGRSGVDTSVSQALGDIPDDQFPSYSYGLQLTVPLGARSQRAAFRSAKAAIEQAQLQYRKVEQSLLITIENTVGSINSTMERVRATREAREYAEAALEAGQKKLEVGKSTTFEVLGLQKNLTQARTDEIRALADYNEALSTLAQNEGTTLANHHLTVKVK